MRIARPQPETDLRTSLGFIAVAEVAVRRAAANPGHRRVRARRQRAVEERERALVIAELERAEVAAQGQRTRVEWVPLQRRLSAASDGGAIGVPVGRPALFEADAVPERTEGMWGRVARVERDRLVEHVTRALELVVTEAVEKIETTQGQLVRVEALGPLSEGAAHLGLADVRRNGRDRLLGGAVLQF